EYYEKQILSHYPDTLHRRDIKTSTSQTSGSADWGSSTKLYFNNEAYDSVSSTSSYTPVTTSSGAMLSTLDTTDVTQVMSTKDSKIVIPRLLEDILSIVFEKFPGLTKTKKSVLKDCLSERSLISSKNSNDLLADSTGLVEEKASKSSKRSQKQIDAESKINSMLPTKKVMFKNVGVATDKSFAPIKTIDNFVFKNIPQISTAAVPKMTSSHLDVVCVDGTKTDNVLDQESLYMSFENIEQDTCKIDAVSVSTTARTIRRSVKNFHSDEEHVIEVTSIVDINSNDAKSVQLEETQSFSEYLKELLTDIIGVVVGELYNESEN
ncbi:hypothetical protein EVAR_62159_1, partial [Eumeta japonica]